MDATHDFQPDAERPLPLSLEEALGQPGASQAAACAEDSEPAGPANALWDSAPEMGKWMADAHLAGADAKVEYRIEGWLAERGTSVWFGAGSTGKTQLMLWMAAMVASRPEDRPEQIWLGGRIHGTGHVLVLTAEDTREQIMGRLKDVVTYSMGQDGAARSRTCSRLHVMPFLSMSEKEFKLPNPSLLALDKERVWGPSEVMLEIRRYISEWNRLHPDEEDRIVGVVMDSATSMSGFDSLDAQATTNFFFYLGRLCERLRIFWVVIGHTPKTTTIPRRSVRETAASRLRGVAMWTTAPRLTVEVRLAQEWHERGRVHVEAPALRNWLGDRVDRRNLLVVYVAKANLKGAWKDERYLARLPRGAFIDVTDQPDEALLSGLFEDGAQAQPVLHHGGSAAQSLSSQAAPRTTPRARRRSAGRPRGTPADFAPGTDYVEALIGETHEDCPTGTRVSANRLQGVVVARRATEPRAALVTSAHGGGKVAARLGSINWHLDQLVGRGLLSKRGRHYLISGARPDDEVAILDA